MANIECAADSQSNSLNSHFSKTFYKEKQTDSKITNKPRKFYQILCATACVFVSMSSGTVFGFSATSLPQMMNSTDSDPLNLTEEQASYVVSAPNIGAVIGCLMSSGLLFYFGQRRSMLATLPMLLISWIFLSFGYTPWVLLVCRFVQGIVCGTFIGAYTSYVVEISHPSIRGKLLGAPLLGQQTGFMFVYLLGSYQLSWRSVALIAGIVIEVIPFVILLFMPDSPRWLASHQKYDEAKKSLIVFRGKKFNIDDEFNKIMEGFSKDTNKLRIIDQVKLLKNRSLAILFVVMVALHFLIYGTGSMAIAAYTVVVFESVSPNVNAYLSTIIFGSSRIVGSLAFILLADRFGRRPVFLIPHMLSVIFIALFGLCFYINELGFRSLVLDWVPVTCMFFYGVFSSISTPSVISSCSELLPTSFRSFGIGLFFAALNVGGFTFNITFLVLVKHLGFAWTFWSYALIGILMFILVLVFIPETSGKTLEDINILNDSKFVKNKSVNRYKDDVL